MEKKVISQIYHEHPLFLRENVRDNSSPNCYGCGKSVANLEMAYVCVQNDCSDKAILHKKCGELPNQIWHPKHSKHPMNLFYFNYGNCDLCNRGVYSSLGYRCSSCDFNVHIRCAEAYIEEREELDHRSHPHHPLTLMRKPAFSFYCDGCCEEDVDKAYICNTCEFWLHKSCASLPATLPINDDHPHQLSLIFSLPKKHRRYMYRCDVCSKYCDASRWAYFCDECRYIVHIKCAIRSSTTEPDGSNLNEDMIEFPLQADDISDKLITPFVMREKGVDHIPIPDTNNASFLMKYFHEHYLSLVSELTHKEEEEEEEEEELLKICDVCIAPLSKSSPYYECAPCKYLIHPICSLLPPTLQYSSSSSSNPNSLLVLGECHGATDKNHNFTLSELNSRDATSQWRCKACGLPTNGTGYECQWCNIKIDVKCASLPTTIRHASHRRCRHKKPLILTRIQRGDTRKSCHGCNEGFYYYNDIAYCCSHEGCDFALHLRCVLLPMSVIDRELDKHPLMLSFDASHNHPSDFFCELCETEMHPKGWMYHCRPCDASFHPECLETASGWYKNIKYGGKYELEGVHHHPLTFTYIQLKKRCGVCRTKWGVYTYLGFQCAECYHVVCRGCGVRELRTKMSL